MRSYLYFCLRNFVTDLTCFLCFLQELPDVPLFLSLHNLCATLKCTSPSAVIFRSAVINAGYRISGSHVNPLALKTDAPMDVVWDIMRCWVIPPYYPASKLVFNLVLSSFVTAHES